LSAAVSIAPDDALDLRAGGHPIETRLGTNVLGAVLMLLLALTGIGLSTMPVVADQLQSVLGLSDAQIGFLTSVFMLSFAVVSIPWGLASARSGGRTLAFGLSVAVAGCLFCSFANSYEGLVIGRLVQGVGLGVVVPTVGVIIPDAITPRLRGRAWGLFGMGHGLGVMLALLILPSVAEAGGYRAVFLTIAGFTALFGGIALAQAPVRRKPARSADVPKAADLVRALGTTVVNLQVLLLCLFNLAGLAVGVGALVWTARFMSEEFAASAQVSAYLTAGLGLAALVGNPLGALAMARWGKRKVIVASMLLMTACIAVVPFLPELWMVFAFVTFAGFLTMAYFSPLFAGAAEVVDTAAEVGAATGLLEVFGFVGALVIPWLFGLLLDTVEGTGGYMLGYLLLAGVSLASCAGLPFLRLPVRAARPSAE
jgi:MFS family permease